MLPAMSAQEIAQQLQQAIVAKLPDATVDVAIGSPGHYSLSVVSAAFAGKNLVNKQRLVYSAIAHLMAGDAAPVHAIDRLTTKVPEA